MKRHPITKADEQRTNLDEFTRAYIECALWSTNDESDPSGGEPLDDNYGLEDIADETLSIIIADCDKFQADNGEDIDDDYQVHSKGRFSAEELAGHDFWLTRSGHGAGFWDGDWTEPQASRLDAAAKAFGECYLYVGDDGKIYM